MESLAWWDGGGSLNFKRLLTALVVVLALLAPSASITTAFADAGQKKTVRVKEYKRKDGTTVKAHDRKPPKSKGSSPAKASKPKKEKKNSTVYTPSSRAPRDERGRLQRSDTARHAFARQTGYPNGRPGYVIDHIIPLACGGLDTPSNMQWQTIVAAKAKDKVERHYCH